MKYAKELPIISLLALGTKQELGEAIKGLHTENKELTEIFRKGIVRTDGDSETLTIHWDHLSEKQCDLITEILNK